MNKEARLIKALNDIIKLEGTEKDEWDAVERIIPKMCRIAKTAILSTCDESEMEEK